MWHTFIGTDETVAGWTLCFVRHAMPFGKNRRPPCPGAAQGHHASSAFSGNAPPFDVTLARTGRIVGLNLCWEEGLHLASRRLFEKDAVIPHTRCRGMYHIARGAVALSHIVACGRERLTLRVGPGCLFNEARTVSSYEPDVVSLS